MRNNKILFVNNKLGGLIQFRLDVIKHLENQGFEVIAVVPLAEKGVVDTRGIKVEYLPFKRTTTNPLSDMVFFYRLVKVFRRERPQYIFLYTIKPNIYGSFAAKLSGIPSSMMMAGLGYTFTNNKLSSRIARLMYRIALKCSDKLMLLNEENVKTVIRLGMCRKEKIIYLKGGEGVNLKKYLYCSNDADIIKFLFVGRLLKEKGVFVFADAAREVKNFYPKVEFQIAGRLDNEYPGSLTKHELDDLVNSGIVTYLGHTNMVEKLKEPGIVIAIPSYYSEGLNRSLMEGCAAGKPIITTNQPGCRETVHDGKNGFLVPVNNPHALAEAMMKFIALSRSEKNQMSRESRLLAEANFDVQKVIKVYDNLISDKLTKFGD